MRIFALAVLLFSVTGAVAHGDTLRLKAEMKMGQPGYTGGAPLVTFKNLPEGNAWKKIEQELAGLPSGWDDFYRTDIWFQAPQVAYQNFKAGNLDTATIADLMESWRFDTADGFSADRVASYTTMVFRKNDTDGVEYLIDTDADYDFSDEEIRRPLEDITYRNVDSLLPYAQWARYQLSVGGVLIGGSVPILVEKLRMKHIGAALTYHLPLYGEVSIEGDTLVVNGRNIDFRTFTVSRLESLDPKSTTHLGERWEKNNRMQLGEEWYQIEGFDMAKEELILRVIDPKRDTIAPQEGFYAPDFTLTNLENSEEFSLADFRGKYVLLDFWGTWCAPCVNGIPHLVDLNNELKAEDFELVSIAYNSKREDIEKLQEEKGMTWIQLMANSEIVSQYNVKAFPTFVLIDPKGKVVRQGLSHKETAEIVRSAEE